ncbi:unnamed protein product [Penicillium bialowiezense]
MKFSTTLVALVAAGLAQAQLPDVPPCSLSCFVSALGSDGCSELLDFKCHCQKTELVSSITPCVKKACDVAAQVCTFNSLPFHIHQLTQPAVSNAVVAQCSSAGYPISVPPVETTSATSAASTGSSSSSSTPAETSATPTATASATSGESSSAAVSSTASASSESSAVVPTSAGSTAVGSSSGAATSTPLGTKTGSASASASSPAYTGAAANVKGNLAGVAAVVAAAAYVL